jgi:hypothetical protein
VTDKTSYLSLTIIAHDVAVGRPVANTYRNLKESSVTLKEEPQCIRRRSPAGGPFDIICDDDVAHGIGGIVPRGLSTLIESDVSA